MADEFDIYVMKRKLDKVEKELLEVKIKNYALQKENMELKNRVEALLEYNRNLDEELDERDKEKENLYECIIDSEGYERCSHCNEHETGMKYFSFCPRCGVKLKH